MGASWRLRGYTIERLLGAGGAGEVWRARVSATGEPVALKRLPVRDAEQARRAQAEAALLTALDHPHLVRLHALVPTADAAVLVLDLADGGSLADLLAARGRLTPGEVITALAPIGAVLSYLHDEGVVHGDVSAANVLFTAAGVAVLADVGVARLAGEDREAAGTPAYLDPAVAAGCVPGPRSDVFMLAAVAFHALTGEPVWRGETGAQAIAEAAQGRTDDVPDRLAAAGVPEPVARVVARGLQVDPHRRGTAADLALDLRHSGEPVAVELRAGRERAVPQPSAPPGPRHAAPPPAARGRARRGHAPAAPPATGSRPATLSRPEFERPSGVPGGVGTAPPTRRVAPPPRPVIPRPAPRPRRRRALLVLLGALVLALVAGAGTVWAGTGEQAGRRVAPAAARATPARASSSRTAPTRASSSRTAPARASNAPAASATRVPASSPPGRTRSPIAPGRGRPAAAAVPWPAGRSAQQWRTVLERLDALRARAFATRDARWLGGIYDSAALRADDAALLTRLVPAGCGLAGARTAYADVRPAAVQGAGAVLTVTATLAPSRLLCAGQVRARAPGTGPVRLRVQLRRVGGAARIAAQQRTTGG